MLLAIDTSSGTSVAIVDRTRGILADSLELDTRRHAEIIGTLIADALATAGIAVGDLDGVVVGMGPGPFTGLRVGIAAARAFAFGASLPLHPVVSHDAIALAELRKTDGPLLVVTDARRREVYWSTYSGLDVEGLPLRTAGPALTRPDELPTVVDGYNGYRRLDAELVPGAALAELADGFLVHSREFAGTDALYLRSPDVTLSAGPKRVS